MVLIALGLALSGNQSISTQTRAFQAVSAPWNNIHASLAPADILEPGRKPSIRPWSCEDPGGRCTWERTYGGALQDKAYGIAAMPDGGAVVAGHSSSQPGFSEDGWILRVDRWGDKIWERRAGGNARDQIYGVANSGKALVLGGHTRSKGKGQSDFWILKIDSDGQLIWENTFGGKGDDRARAVAATETGHYALVGTTKSYSDPNGDAWMVMVDRHGRHRWDRTFGSTGEDSFFHVAALANGDLAAAGYTHTGEQTGFDLWVLRIDGSSGSPIWERRFHRGILDSGNAVVPTPDNGLLVAGVTSADGYRHDKVWILRLNEDGRLLWQQTFGGTGPDAAWGADRLPGGRYVVAAATNSQGAGSTDAWLLCLDDRGRLLWERTFGGKRWDRPTATVRISANGLFLLGNTTSQGAGYEDYWLLRLDPRGRF